MQIYQPKITQFETKEVLYTKSAEVVLDTIMDSISDNGLSRISLSGGSSPLPLYKLLGSNHNFDWHNVELYQSDERYIDSNSSKSNKKNIIENFSQETLGQLKNYFFINTSIPFAESVQNYNEVIDSLDGVFFDISIVGIGTDGHIASLFPNSEYLKHNDDFVIATKAPKQFDIEDRISLTVETILNSKKILILLIGESKKEIISELLEGQKSVKEFPAKFLLSHPNLHIFFSE